MKKNLIDSTTTTKLCNHPILVRVDDIEKEKLASGGEKSQETSIVAPQSIEAKFVFPIIVYQVKNVVT